MPKSEAETGRLGRLLGGALVVLMPAFFVDGFHDPFTASKLILLLLLGVPATLLLTPGRNGHDPLNRWRRAAIVLAPIWVLGAWMKGHPEPYPLILIATGLTFLSIGAAFGATAEGRARIVLLAAISAVPVLLVGLLRRYADLLTFIPDRPDVALAATIGNSNELAEYAAPLAILALLIPARGQRGGWLLVGSAMALVVLSESRGGVIALGVGLLISGFAMMRRASPARGAGRMACSLVLIGALLAGVFAADRVASVVDLDHPTNVVRLGLWSAALTTWLDNPVLGCGAGRFEAAVPPHRETSEWLTSGFATIAESPHNEALWLLATGGLLGVATLLVACSIVLRSWRDARAAAKTDDELVDVAACVGALAAFAVVAMVRSPLHHPTGVMIPALVAGVLGAMAGKGAPAVRPVAPALWLTWLSLTTATWAGCASLVDASRVHTARRSKVEANEALKAGRPGEAVAHFRSMTDALRALRSSPAVTAALGYRAGLVGSDLEPIRDALMQNRETLEQQGFGSPNEWLPSRDDVVALLDGTLRRAPHHHLALLERARIHLEAGEIASAASALDDPAWRGIPWVDRLELLGAVALRQGTTAETFGFWLRDAPQASGVEDHAELAHAALLAAEAASDPLVKLKHSVTARVEAFRSLGSNPYNPGVMKVLTDLATRATPPPSWGNRAVARSRVLLARDALVEGDGRMARVHLRIARSKDPQLLDAHYLAARLATQRGEASALQRSVTILLEGGVPAAVLLEHAKKDGIAAAIEPLLR